ncbi:transmembrane protein 107 [Pyxicephalus adspersus]|uniref:transmembrane protein 107 n=1 Tax=Pyxicephalus adspersus TaxID=30357 RepID=UPI003B5AE136
MTVINGLIPARFLTLLAHMVIVITIFWSRGNNVLACLPVSYTQDQYNAADTEAAFGFQSAYCLLPRFAFLDISLSALVAHCSASVSLSLFVSEKWECTDYWYIFGFCSAFPAFTEILIVIIVLGFKRKPL